MMKKQLLPHPFFFAPVMSANISPKYKNNPATEASDGRYIDAVVDTEKVLESWRDSMFSFEWLDDKGQIKTHDAMRSAEREKRETIEKNLTKDEPVTKAILGIGINDNVEIGSGRAEFMTLAARGIQKIPVHIPKSQADDFKPYLAQGD